MPKSDKSRRKPGHVDEKAPAQSQCQLDPQSPSTVTARSEDATALSAKDRVAEINERNANAREIEDDLALKRKLVPRLAKRAYHLEEGNSWCQDWIQYQKNTHPVFSLCMYHRFHPVRLPQRIIILVGSIAFGFAITNCVYLGYMSSENAGVAVNYVYQAAGTVVEVTHKYTNVELKQSMVFLLTIGSFLHSLFDMFIWYLMACFCFRPGGVCQGEGGRRARICQNFGIYAAVLVVVAAVVAATAMAIFRLNGNEEREVEISSSMVAQFTEEKIIGQEAADETTFLIGYALELVLALFVFYFFTSTVLFSGILGCGRVPVFGGRPYEIRKAREGSEDGNAEGDEAADKFDEEAAVGMQPY